MQNVFFKDIGLVDYKKAWDFQEKLFNKTLSIKSKNKNEATGNKTERSAKLNTMSIVRFVKTEAAL